MTDSLAHVFEMTVDVQLALNSSTLLAHIFSLVHWVAPSLSLSLPHVHLELDTTSNMDDVINTGPNIPLQAVLYLYNYSWYIIVEL